MEGPNIRVTVSPSDPALFKFSKLFDAFKTFYINKYIDNHAYEIAFTPKASKCPKAIKGRGKLAQKMI
jgi:hypothetical protein